jgi:hypothetical protein
MILRLVWSTFEQWFLRANMLKGTLTTKQMQQEGGMFLASQNMVQMNPKELLGFDQLWSFVLGDGAKKKTVANMDIAVLGAIDYLDFRKLINLPRQARDKHRKLS